MRETYVYRLVIRYPEGSHDEHGFPVTDWKPDWWDQDRYFQWPRKRQFLSRTAAAHRASQFEECGAEVVIVRSQPVEWVPGMGD